MLTEMASMRSTMPWTEVLLPVAETAEESCCESRAVIPEMSPEKDFSMYELMSLRRLEMDLEAASLSLRRDASCLDLREGLSEEEEVAAVTFVVALTKEPDALELAAPPFLRWDLISCSSTVVRCCFIGTFRLLLVEASFALERLTRERFLTSCDRLRI